MQQDQDENREKSTGISEKNYKLLGILIIFFALLIRLLDLGERVFHHDESVHASFTLKLLEQGKYNPSLRLAHDVAKALNSTIDDLFIFDDENPVPESRVVLID